MKYSLYLCLTILLISCKNNPPSESTETTVADSVKLENTIPAESDKPSVADLNTLMGTYKIDEGSIVSWTGTAPGKSHVGTLNIKSGEFVLENGNFKSGTFVMDMTSLVNTDLTSDKGKEKLEKHLKDVDFFDVAKYPDATFTITKSNLINGNDKVTHKITGDLKIKDVSQPISFDAYVIASDGGNVITATTPNFEIDRTKYGIKYNSGLINTAKDKIINDKVGLVINIRAKK